MFNSILILNCNIVAHISPKTNDSILNYQNCIKIYSDEENLNYIDSIFSDELQVSFE